MPYACGVLVCSCRSRLVSLAPDSYQLQTKIFACEVCLLSSHICGTARSAFFRSAVRRIAFARRRESSATLTHRAACISLLDTWNLQTRTPVCYARATSHQYRSTLHLPQTIRPYCSRDRTILSRKSVQYHGMIAQRQACTSLPSSHLAACVAPKRVGARRASLLYTRTSRSSLSIPCRPFSSAGWSALCT